MLKRHIAEETGESMSGIHYIQAALQEQWLLTSSHGSSGATFPVRYPLVLVLGCPPATSHSNAVKENEAGPLHTRLFPAISGLLPLGAA